MRLFRLLAEQMLRACSSALHFTEPRLRRTVRIRTINYTKSTRTTPSCFLYGWDGRIRTYDLLVQSEAPYRLATSHQRFPKLPYSVARLKKSAKGEIARKQPRLQGGPLYPYASDIAYRIIDSLSLSGIMQSGSEAVKRRGLWDCMKLACHRK